MEHKMLESYNDVFTIVELMEILHIGKNTAYGLLQDGEVKRETKIPIGNT